MVYKRVGERQLETVRIKDIVSFSYSRTTGPKSFYYGIAVLGIAGGTAMAMQASELSGGMLLFGTAATVGLVGLAIDGLTGLKLQTYDLGAWSWRVP